MQLTTVRRERFCRLLAQGLPLNQAYEQAGFAPNDGNAGKLFHNTVIQARLKELMNGEELDIFKPEGVPEAPIEPSDEEVTTKWILQQLVNLIHTARSGSNYPTAFRAVELLGEYYGMWGKTVSPQEQAKRKEKNKKEELASLSTLIKAFDKKNKKNADTNTDTETDDTSVPEKSKGPDSRVGAESDDQEDNGSGEA